MADCHFVELVALHHEELSTPHISLSSLRIRWVPPITGIRAWLTQECMFFVDFDLDSDLTYRDNPVVSDLSYKLMPAFVCRYNWGWDWLWKGIPALPYKKAIEETKPDAAKAVRYFAWLGAYMISSTRYHCTSAKDVFLNNRSQKPCCILFYELWPDDSSKKYRSSDAFVDALDGKVMTHHLFAADECAITQMPLFKEGMFQFKPYEEKIKVPILDEVLLKGAMSTLKINTKAFGFKTRLTLFLI